MSETAAKEMWLLRNGFYKWLADYVTELSREVIEFRRPSEERGKRKKGKIIGFVNSVTQGAQIKGEIQGKLSDTNAQLVSLGSSAGVSVTPIKVKVEVISPLGDVALTQNAAQRRISVEGKAIKRDINDYIKYLKAQEKPNFRDINAANELYKAISDNELYISATDSGISYRVTYYSHIDGARKQQNVCDVLLIAGNDTRLIAAPQRKERADKAVQLGIYYKRLLDTDIMILHRVYEFNQRYIDRRIQRLANK